MFLGALSMLIGLRSIPGAAGTLPELNIDSLARDKGMATVDRQIDVASAMTRGEEGLVVRSNTRESRHRLKS